MVFSLYHVPSSRQLYRIFTESVLHGLVTLTSNLLTFKRYVKLRLLYGIVKTVLVIFRFCLTRRMDVGPMPRSLYRASEFQHF